MTARDPVYHAAFDRMLQLPGTDTPRAAAPDPVDDLPPADRERAGNIALRRLAFQLLYEIDAGATSVESVGARLTEVEGLGPIARERVLTLVAGAFAARTAADAEFLALAPEWPAHRQAAVDRAILRLAYFELTATSTPAKVAVHEAVELAKHFSTEKSPAFVNALLDRVMRRLHPQDAA